MKKLLSLFSLLAIVVAAGAQPRCNADGTVTFLYKNENAKKVQVDVQFAGRHDMTRSADGLWTVTLGPAAPDMYPYCFIVDGISVMDPENQQYFPNEGFKNSLLEIPSTTGSLPHDIRDVEHGRIEYVNYYSKTLGATNHAIVYLPPSYMRNMQKRYPVFYLISGTTDTEEVYYKVGRVNYILDNLLADGKAKEMIVVLPYGNPSHLFTGSGLPAAGPANGAPQTRFGGDVFSRDLINDLLPYVDKNYRTVKSRAGRAVCGLSMGGGHTFAISLLYPTTFDYYGLFSAGLHLGKDFNMQQPFAEQIKADPDFAGQSARLFGSKPKLYWMGMGNTDFLYQSTVDLRAYWDSKGYKYEYVETDGGHIWRNWRIYLTMFAQKVFK